MGKSDATRLRSIVGGIAVELAFRRYLNDQKVPFDVEGITPFTDPDKYDVSLGGRRCDIKSFIISRRDQIVELKRDPNLLMGASALVPSDQFAARAEYSSRDLYIFAFLTGLFAASQADIAKAKAAQKPIHLIHTMPKTWAKPKIWASLGDLALKSDCEKPVMVDLGGQDAEGAFLVKRLMLEPRKRLVTEAGFHTLAYVHVSHQPHGRLGIHSAMRDETYLISPYDFKNIWFYGMRVILAGYLTMTQFREKARELPEGSRVYQYRRTRTKNLAVPLRELNPLAGLFEQVQNWDEKRRSHG